MRIFMLFAQKATIEPFPLNNMPGAGRMDIIARCVTSALWVSHGIRRDTKIYCFLLKGKTVLFDGNLVRRLSPDERSVGSWLNKALAKECKNKWNKVQEGIFVSEEPIENIIKDVSKGKQIFILDENGTDIREVKFEKHVVFLIGDHIGIPKQIEKVLGKIEKISLCKKSYLASSCISIVHNEIDRRN